MPKAKLIDKVSSLFDLKNRAQSDPQYLKLAVAGAQNLGGNVKNGDLEGAMRWLRLNAQETDERGVVAEVNACRDLV